MRIIYRWWINRQRKKEEEIMNELTVKQSDFCLFYIETGNASEAYRRAYDAENMKPETVNRRAFDLMENSKIKARIEALQAEHRKEHNITVSDILNKLEDIYSEAMKKGNLSSAVSAVMGQAKVLGFDKQTINLEGDVKPLPAVINVTFSDEP